MPGAIPGRREAAALSRALKKIASRLHNLGETSKIAPRRLQVPTITWSSYGVSMNRGAGLTTEVSVTRTSRASISLPVSVLKNLLTNYRRRKKGPIGLVIWSKLIREETTLDIYNERLGKSPNVGFASRPLYRLRGRRGSTALRPSIRLVKALQGTVRHRLPQKTMCGRELLLAWQLARTGRQPDRPPACARHLGRMTY